jgi:cellulose synthase/poly-beta-1,6-N-acetylglucosamine synthase-like glycosyltransferase
MFIAYLIVFFGLVNLIRIAIFLIGSDIYQLKKAKYEKFKKRIYPLPTVSVIIPTHNEESTITRCVTSVITNSYPENKLQIIIVNNNSTDSTSLLVKKLIRQYPHHNLKLAHCSKAGKAHALNHGLKRHATGEIVMCLDSDSYIHPNAIRNAVEYFRNPKVVGLAANVKISPNQGIFNLIQRFEYLICYQMKRAESLFNIEYIIGGIGSTFRYQAISNVGFYDSNTVTEDIDLTAKLLSLGNKDNRVIYGSDVIAYTESVPDIHGLIRQRTRWKYGRSQTFFKNPSLFFGSPKKYTYGLSWIYLPLAIFFDIAFFFEPLMVGFILYLSIVYVEVTIILSALVVISSYIIFNILAEDTLTTKEKLYLIIISPTMYFYFYILSFAEYIALITTIIKLPTLRKELSKHVCSWQHVSRKPNINS